MGQIKTRVTERIVMGLVHGGKIPMPIIDASISDAIDYLYEQTEIVKADLSPISEVAGQRDYDIPDFSTDGGGRICRVLALYRVSRDSNGVELSRRAINPAFYKIGLKTNETASVSSISTKLTLYSPPSSSATDSLILEAVMAFAVDDYISPMHLDDAEVAIASRAMRVLSMDTGKPWSSLQKSQVEELRCLNAIARIRYKETRGNTGREVRMVCSESFV